MPSQPNLFSARPEPTPEAMPTDVPHVWHSETSRMSAAELKPFAGPIGWVVREAIRVLGGATCEQVEDYLKMKHQTVSGRIPRLVENGYLRDSGARQRNRSGRMAVIWAACNAPSVPPRVSRYAEGRRDALLEIKGWMVKQNFIKGDWWLNQCGKDTIAEIDNRVKGNDDGNTSSE